MNKKNSFIIIVGIMITIVSALGIALFPFDKEIQGASKQTGDTPLIAHEARSTLKTYWEQLKKGDIEQAKIYLAGSALQRMNQVTWTPSTQIYYTIGKERNMGSYYISDVWGRDENQLEMYRYHVSDTMAGWRITFVESAIPNLPEKPAKEVDEQARRVIESFVRHMAKGEEVSDILLPVLQKQYQVSGQNLVQTIEPVIESFSFEPVSEEVENEIVSQLVRTKYTVDGKSIENLFHVVTLDGLSKISAIIPVQ
jgi:hypothetical protein